MARTPGRQGHKQSASNRRTSVMTIAAVLNHSTHESEERPRTLPYRTRQAASCTSLVPIRTITHHSLPDMLAHSAPTVNHRRAWSSAARSPERRTSLPRRPNRPAYSKEEQAFIWFHRVDLNQEWDAVVRAFNTQFPHSNRRDKSGLECKLYRVLNHYKIPQIREWKQRGNHMVEEVVSYFGIIESTNIRYPWMGPRYWPPREWQ
jgi:hypothetical protein